MRCPTPPGSRPGFLDLGKFCFATFQVTLLTPTTWYGKSIYPHPSMQRHLTSGPLTLLLMPTSSFISPQGLRMSIQQDAGREPGYRNGLEERLLIGTTFDELGKF